jgi:hypothetical protein
MNRRNKSSAAHPGRTRQPGGKNRAPNFSQRLSAGSRHAHQQKSPLGKAGFAFEISKD